jgi:multiple sugar transport system ATP-binding protein
LEELTAGTIRIQDRAVNNVAPKDRDIAMVFQHHALYPHMTVSGNIAFGLRMRQIPRAQIRQRVTEVSNLLHLQHLLARYPSALSGGERQRVALGRAIVRRPQVFLLDEPLSNLDACLRVRMRAEIKSLHRSLNTTILYVTHDQEEAMTLGDRIIVLDRGRVQQVGAPLDVYHRPANRFVAGFVGTPPMNFLEGRFEHNDGAVRLGTAFGSFRVPPGCFGQMTPEPGQRVVLGMRPEHLCIDAPRPSQVQTAGPSAAGAAFDGEGTGPPHAAEMSCTLGTFSVRAVEPMGDRLYIHLALSENATCVARVSPDTDVSSGDRVVLHADLARAHWFRADQTGLRLE